MSEPRDWAGPEVAKGLNENEAISALAQIGWLPGIDAGGELGLADPDPENEPERPNGISVVRNPFAELRDDRELWRIWDEWRLGYRQEPTAREYAALSAWHLEVLRELRCTQARALRRSIPQPKDPPP